MARKTKSALVQRVEYAAYRTVARLIRNAPEERVARWGSRFGALSRRVIRGRDRLAMRNLRLAFPDRDARELRQILDECWRHFGREMLGYVRIQDRSLDEIVARCTFEETHFLQEAIDHGKGVLLISAHWGGWEVGGLALMSLIRNVRMVARRLDNDYLERDLVKLRSKTGAEIVDRRNAARSLLKWLSEKAIVVVLPDQAVQAKEGILVPFMGRDAWTTPGPAKMALRTDSTIVFAFCIPIGTRYRIVFEEPIHTDELPEAERDPVALTKRINDVISRRIAERPELWLWMHDRWKATGESEAVHD